MEDQAPRGSETARARSSRTQSLVEASSSWLYPFKGIYYFATHSFLWPLLKARLLPCFVLSIIILGTLFAFAYLPQVAFLAIWHGPLAWVNGAFLVLGEGAVIIQAFFEAFFVDETLVDVFDSVLINEGLVDLVSPSRTIHPDGENPARQLGRPTKSAQYSPFSFRLIVEFILFIPLNFIPVVGTPLFLVLTGRRAGPLHHWRYFKLLGYSSKERKAATKSRRWRYTWFGTAALVLQLIPGLAMLFLLTTAAGSALWASKLEKRRLALEAVADLPPDYVDAPI